jgi:hypothetical protein
MRSSTSSSESVGTRSVPYREIPDRPWPRLLLFAAVITVVAVAAWEVLARSMYHVPGTYDDYTGDAWAMERRKLDDPEQDVRVVLTGSSRMLWAADLDILEEGLGTRPLQLALPGTSPRIIVEHLVNTTDFDGLLLVGYTPMLFNLPGAGEFGQVALDAYQQNAPGKRVGYRIHRWLSEHLGFLDESFDLFTLVEAYASAQLPVREGSENLNAFGWKLGDTYADRQTDMWEPIETPGTFDWQQVVNFWTGGEPDLGPPPPPERLAELAADANAFFAPLVDEMRSRGGDIVFIRLPSDGDYRRVELEGDIDAHLWRPHVEGLDALSINSWDYPELSTELEIPEWSHLNRRSQDDWSRAVVPILLDRYRAFRGRLLHEALGLPDPGRPAPAEIVTEGSS